MALLTATISGKLLRPDLTAGAMTVTIHAVTDGTRLAYSGKVLAGRIPVKIRADGTARVTLPQIPQAGLTPTGALWRIRFKTAYDDSHWDFNLTGDTTWDAIVDVSDVPITPAIQAAAEAARDQAIAAAGSISSSVGAIVATNTTYGALGNGSHDDTTNIQAAIDAANTAATALGVTDVLLPAGTYMISGSLNVKAHVRLRGTGRGATVIKSTSGAATAALVRLTGANDCSVEDLAVDVNGRTNSIGIQSTPAASGATRYAVRRCRVINSTNSAIRADTHAINGLVVEDNLLDTCVSGIQILGVTSEVFKDVAVRGNRLTNVGGNNIQFTGSAQGQHLGAVVTGNYLHDFQQVGANGPIPIEVTYVDNAMVAHNYIGATGTRGISTGNCNDLTITGNSIRGQSVYAVEIAVSKRVSITGNVVDSCAQYVVETSAQVEDLTISGNTFAGTGLTSTLAASDGIGLKNGVRRAQITGNVFNDWQFVRSAIRIGESGNAAQDVTVADNTFIISDANTPITAIACRKAVRSFVSRNQIKVLRNLAAGDDTADVIQITPDAASSDIVANDNDILYTGTVTAATNHAGIGHGSSGAATLPGLVVRRNRIKAGQHGFRFGSITSADQIIEDNDARTCTSFATDATNAALVYKRTVRIFEASSIPTAGTWQRGDRVVASLPSVGAAKGWVCTASGTPGTWVSEGNL